MNFVFEKDLKYLIANRKIFYDATLEETRGLYAPNINVCFINLSATQWNMFFAMGEEVFINEISKTITHEHCHQIIGNIIGRFTGFGEEKVVKILAEQ